MTAAFHKLERFGGGLHRHHLVDDGPDACCFDGSSLRTGRASPPRCLRPSASFDERHDQELRLHAAEEADDPHEATECDVLERVAESRAGGLDDDVHATSAGRGANRLCPEGRLAIIDRGNVAEGLYPDDLVGAGGDRDARTTPATSRRPKAKMTQDLSDRRTLPPPNQGGDAS